MTTEQYICSKQNTMILDNTFIR